MDIGSLPAQACPCHWSHAAELHAASMVAGSTAPCFRLADGYVSHVLHGIYGQWDGGIRCQSQPRTVGLRNDLSMMMQHMLQACKVPQAEASETGDHLRKDDVLQLSYSLIIGNASMS